MSEKKPPDWGEIERLYVVDHLSPQSISEIFDVKPKAVSMRAMRCQWGEKRKKLAEDLMEAAISERKNIAVILSQIHEKALEKILNDIANGKARSIFYLEAMKQVGKQMNKAETTETKGFEFINLPGIDTNSV